MEDWTTHPVKRLIDAGANVTISTDDPAMFDCTLAGEYEALQEHCGYHSTVLIDLAENAIRAAWIGSGQRERLLTELTEWRRTIE